MGTLGKERVSKGRGEEGVPGKVRVTGGWWGEGSVVAWWGEGRVVG